MPLFILLSLVCKLQPYNYALIVTGLFLHSGFRIGVTERKDKRETMKIIFCTFSVRDLGLIPGLGRSPGEGNGYPLQCSGLENSIDCIVHGVTKSQTWLSNFHCNPNWPQLYSIASSSFKYVGILNYFRWVIASLNKIEDLSITEASHRHWIDKEHCLLNSLLWQKHLLWSK